MGTTAMILSSKDFQALDEEHSLLIKDRIREMLEE